MGQKVNLSEEEIAKLPLLKLVYCYRFLDTAGKVLNVWMDEETRDKRIFGGGVKASPGMRYTFPALEGGEAILTSRKKYVGRWSDLQEVSVWEARDLEEELRHKALLNEKDEKKSGPLNQAVKVVREAYKLQGTAQKRSRFLIWLVDELNK